MQIYDFGGVRDKIGSSSAILYAVDTPNFWDELNRQNVAVTNTTDQKLACLVLS